MNCHRSACAFTWAPHGARPPGAPAHACAPANSITWPAIYLAGLGLIALGMLLLWLLSLRLRNAAIVDIFWGTGFVLLAWMYFALGAGYLPRQLLVAALVTIWGARLSPHIWQRNRGRPEDFRYRAWRLQWGGSFVWRSLLQVFLLQGALLWLISAPLLLAQAQPAPAALGRLDALGTLLWLAGFAFEAGGDWQLQRFKANPANAGRVLDSGLWRYTRHPNYFGDALIWWGLYLLAAASPLGAWAITSPLLMTVLLMRVSGVTMLEQTLAQRPAYREYIARTPAFFPWWPKRTE